MEKSLRKAISEMEGKKISEMTDREILRQQLEWLAEVSRSSLEELLPRLTEAMCQLYDRLK